MSRTIMIGDIHGCLEEFLALVDKLALQADDRVICLGDFMDKGPDPAGCVRLARECGFESVVGNHEEKHVRWRQHEDRKGRDSDYVNPMNPLPEKYQRDNIELTTEDVAWLRTLPLHLKPAPGWVVVHGGLVKGRTLEEQLADKRSTLLRLRWVHRETGKPIATKYTDDGKSLDMPTEAVHWTKLYDGDLNVVYGHEAHSLKTPRVDVVGDVSCYGIDTGVVHGGHLTAMVLEDGAVSYVQIEAKKVYQATPHKIPS